MKPKNKMKPKVKSFFDCDTSTYTHVVYESDGCPCAIVDPVLNFDPKSGRTSTAGADQVLAFVRDHRLTVQWLLETHAHADHISAAPYIREQIGGTIGIGARIKEVQAVFKKLFNLASDYAFQGEEFDHLFEDEERFFIGSLKVRAMNVPGHTPADMAYVVEENTVFVGDTMFMPDVGTARCDFPGGDPHILYRSIKRILSLTDDTELLMCHDYPPSSRLHQCKTTVRDQRQKNIHIRDAVSENEFVEMRNKRDATLPMPTLLLPSIQVNIRAGLLPEAEENGVRYLKIPLNSL